MNDKYEQELAELKKRMQKAEKFAERIPGLRNVILDKKLTGEEVWLDFGSRYKETPLRWGIKRGYYKLGTSRRITNFREEHACYCFCIYINTLSLFDIHENFSLYEKTGKCKVFFIDKMNSTFYVEDEHIKDFLEALNLWYIEAKKELAGYRKNERIQELKDELHNLEEETALSL